MQPTSTACANASPARRASEGKSADSAHAGARRRRAGHHALPGSRCRCCGVWLCGRAGACLYAHLQTPRYGITALCARAGYFRATLLAPEQVSLSSFLRRAFRPYRCLACAAYETRHSRLDGGQHLGVRKTDTPWTALALQTNWDCASWG